MRVLVCGGRKYRNEFRVYQALDCIHAARPFTKLIHGASSGADSLAAQWGVRRLGPDAVDPYPADWDNLDHPKGRIRWNSRSKRFYDANAGFRRNLRMLIEGAPELVIAFPGGSGTADMVAKALRNGVAVMEVYE